MESSHKKHWYISQLLHPTHHEHKNWVLLKIKYQKIVAKTRTLPNRIPGPLEPGLETIKCLSCKISTEIMDNISVFKHFASGMFPKHLIHRLVILLHRNLWMGYCANIEQVLGPPFDKMSWPVTARQACQIWSPMTRLWGPCTKDCTKHVGGKFLMGSVVVNIAKLVCRCRWEIV
jgi:hypothetical protein